MAKHASLSPSGAPAWLRCHAKVWREKGLPDDSSEAADDSSEAADEGTAAHFLLSQCLTYNVAPKAHLGKRIGVDEDGDAFWNDGPNACDHYHTHVDDEMVSAIQKTLDWIREFDGDDPYCDGTFTERSYSITHITGEEGAEGTVDVTQAKERTLAITDLKYGKGVQVFAEGNEQLLIYGDAVLEQCDPLEEIETITLRIAQPRLDHFDEWTVTRAELKRRIAEIRATAEIIRTAEDPTTLRATPGEKQCKFCRAKATCPEFRNYTLGAVVFEPVVELKKGEVAVTAQDAERLIAQAYGVKPAAVTVEHGVFIVKKPNIVPKVEAALERITSETDEQLATVMDAADMIEQFVKAVRAEVERRLLSGQFSDARYKLVEGKKGARKWIDEVEAEKVLKAMRLKIDQMYDMAVKSPTQIEKVIKDANPRKWAKLQDQITQGGGKPSVAPASDARPALNMKVEFEPVVDVAEVAAEFTEALAGLSVEDDLI